MTGNADWFEIHRKIFHITLGIALVLTIYFDLLKDWMVFAILIIGVIISISSRYFDIPLIRQFLGKFEREKHLKNIPGQGVLSIFAALLIIMLFFDKDIVLASMMIWTLGDSMSAIIGRHYGKRKHPFNDSRMILGTIFGMIVATLGAWIFVRFWIALVAACIAMALESLELEIFGIGIDDNLLVPIISAVVMYLVMMI
jgi:dolichol kinase